MNDLDKLFKHFETRKAEEQVTEEQAADVLAHKILPVVADLAEQIRAKGHGVDVLDETRNTHPPRIRLNFTPKSPLPSEESKASMLTFSLNDRGYVMAEQRVEAKGGKRARNASDMAKVEEVTEGWAREKTIGFVKSVLDAS